MNNLKAPFPYFGGKQMIADKVWQYLGDVKQYIEPFFGSGAVLLNRPETKYEKKYEIVNDKDGFIANVWRAIKYKPDETAYWCDYPINHADLCARRKVLLREEQNLIQQLINDDMFCNTKLAGYWIWAASCWIGSGLTRPKAIPHLTGDKGVNSIAQIPHLTGDTGVNSVGKIPHLTSDMGVVSNKNIYQWMNKLAERLRFVKVVCGDWTRVCGGNWQDKNKPVGMFFDPPYATDIRDDNIYHNDSLTVGKDVEKWVLQRGDNPNYRIVVCGYEGEYNKLISAGWTVEAWKANGGYGNMSKSKNENRKLERLFISPHCCKKIDEDLFQNS